MLYLGLNKEYSIVEGATNNKIITHTIDKLKNQFGKFLTQKTFLRLFTVPEKFLIFPIAETTNNRFNKITDKKQIHVYINLRFYQIKIFFQTYNIVFERILLVFYN